MSPVVDWATMLTVMKIHSEWRSALDTGVIIDSVRAMAAAMEVRAAKRNQRAFQHCSTQRPMPAIFHDGDHGGCGAMPAEN